MVEGRRQRDAFWGRKSDWSVHPASTRGLRIEHAGGSVPSRVVKVEAWLHRRCQATPRERM